MQSAAGAGVNEARFGNRSAARYQGASTGRNDRRAWARRRRYAVSRTSSDGTPICVRGRGAVDIDLHGSIHSRGNRIARRAQGHDALALRVAPGGPLSQNHRRRECPVRGQRTATHLCGNGRGNRSLYSRDRQRSWRGGRPRSGATAGGCAASRR